MFANRNKRGFIGSLHFRDNERQTEKKNLRKGCQIAESVFVCHFHRLLKACKCLNLIRYSHPNALKLYFIIETHPSYPQITGSSGPSSHFIQSETCPRGEARCVNSSQTLHHSGLSSISFPHLASPRNSKSGKERQDEGNKRQWKERARQV